MNTPTSAPKARRRGPIGRLDLDGIVAAGLAIAGRPGVTTITVRELGAELKADPTSIYRHVESKDGLIQLLLDRLTGMIRERSASAADWRQHLTSIALATLEVYLQYPAIGSQAMRLSSTGEQELMLVEGILQALRDSGLDHDQAVRFYGLYSVFVLSYCAGAAAARLDDAGADSEALWIDRPLDVDPGLFPRVAESRAGLARLTDLTAFRDGIELILDAAAAVVLDQQAKRTTSTGRS
jgi:AcrR family transcriptional regulator